MYKYEKFMAVKKEELQAFTYGSRIQQFITALCKESHKIATLPSPY